MSNLAVVTNEMVVSRISLSPENFLLDVLKQEKIRNLDWNMQIVSPMVVILIKSAQLLGISNEIPSTNLEDMKVYITTSGKGFTIEEYAYALQLERFGDLGEVTKHFHNFNAVYLSTVMNKYKKWKTETRVAKKLPIALIAEAPKRSREEINEALKSEIIVCYNDWLETKKITLGYNYIYDVLDELGEMPTDKEEKKEIYKQAKKEVHKDIKKKKSGTFVERLKFADMLRRMEQKNLHEHYITKSKDISLRKYFESLGGKKDAINNIVNKYYK